MFSLHVSFVTEETNQFTVNIVEYKREGVHLGV